MVQIIGNRLAKTIRLLANRGTYFCSAENISSNQAVHEIRRLFKRLRALLRFYKKIPESTIPHLAEDIRVYGKLLAALRESAVNIVLFNKEIATNKLLSEKKIKYAHEMLVQKNRLLLERGFRENNLRNTIRSFYNDFEILFADSSESPTKNQIFREISLSYLKSYTFYRQLPADPHPEEWHKLRKKLKQLWYQIDFIRFLHPRYFKLKTDQLNKITDQLGDDHDLHIFATDFRSCGYGFNEEELQILEKQVEHLRELNQQKLQPRLKQFFTAPPLEFEQKLIRFFNLDLNAV